MRTVSGLSSSMAHYLREGLAAGRRSMTGGYAGWPGRLTCPRCRRVRRGYRFCGYRRSPAGRSGDGYGELRPVRLLDALLLTAVARPGTAGEVTPPATAECGGERPAVDIPGAGPHAQRLDRRYRGGPGRRCGRDRAARRRRATVRAGETLTGIWRDACEQVAGWLGGAAEDNPWLQWVDWMFGSQPDRDGDRAARAHLAPQPAALALPRRLAGALRAACRIARRCRRRWSCGPGWRWTTGPAWPG